MKPMNNANTYSQQGDACLQSGDLSCAVENYTKAIELGTNREAVYYNRGQAYAVQGLYKEAIADLEQFLKLTPRRHYTYLAEEDIKALRIPNIKVYLTRVTESSLKSCLCATSGTVTTLLFSTIVQTKDGLISFETTELHGKDNLITVYHSLDTNKVITTGYLL